MPAAQHRRLHDGLEWPHQLEIIDRRRARVHGAGRRRAGQQARRTRTCRETANKIDERLRTRVQVKAGPRTVGVTFVKRNHAESDEPLQPSQRDHDLQDMNGLPLIDHVNLTGPFDATGPGDTPSRRRIFACRPAQATEEAACARTILSTLARRAYRRPVDDADDPTPILELLRRGPQAGHLRHRHRERAAADPRQPEVPVPRRDRRPVGRRGDRSAISSCVAPVVLPVEQHPRR